MRVHESNRVYAVRSGDRQAAMSTAREVLDDAGIEADIVEHAPKWKPGDVVVVRFSSVASTRYTYVRGLRYWPGESSRGLTDEKVTELYRRGLVVPKLQAGGEPFDEDRLPGDASDRALDELRDRLTRPGAPRPGRIGPARPRPRGVAW